MFDFKHPSNSNPNPNYTTHYIDFEINLRQRRQAAYRKKFTQETYVPPGVAKTALNRMITGAEIDTVLDDITKSWDL